MTGFLFSKWNVLLSLLSYERATWAIPLPFGLNFLLHFFLLYFFLSLFFTSTSSLSMDCHLSPGCLWICQYVYMYCCSSSHTLSSSTPAPRDYKLHDTWSQFQAYPQTPSSFLEAEKAGHDRTRCLHENMMSRRWKKEARKRRACRVTLDWIPIGEFNCWSLCCINAAFERRGKWAETPQWPQHFRDVIKDRELRKKEAELHMI